jgi:predicted P-loop ATPase
MTAANAFVGNWGGDLTAQDYDSLAARWITRELADYAGIRRVSDTDGRFMFRRRTDTEGMIIPNFDPWLTDRVRQYRIRLDNPPREPQADGTFKEVQKYLQPPEGSNLLYVPRGALKQVGADVPIIITEGEFKALALWRLANHETAAPRFLPVALAGVWSWRGSSRTNDARGRRVSISSVIPDMERFPWKGTRVIIAFDADLASNPQVKAARWALTRWLTEQGSTVGHLDWDISEGKGIDDRLANIGPESALAGLAAVEYGDWHMRLIRDDNGDPRACYENIRLILEHSPEWDGVLGYNEFSAAHMIMRTPPALINFKVGDELEDHFDTELTQWLERQKMMARPDQVRLVVDAVSRRNPFHPVRDYLNNLPKWDGVSRIGSWLIDYCGVESSDANPNHFAMAVGAKFLISAVKRVMEPGAKCDSVLVLEGQQGIGKSTVPRILAVDDWFSDQLADMGSKDASMQLRGVWIVELSELDVLNRAELARAKAFLSQQAERFRLPYGRRLIQAPRQCVFVGTTNADSWLKDETGGRRFWPVRCRQIDLDGLRRDRDHLWAEALHHYRAGVTWWLDDIEVVQAAIEEQRSRYQADVWQEQISKWLDAPAERFDDRGHPVASFNSSRESVTIPDVLSHCIGKPLEMWTQSDKMRIAACLTSLGWERYKAGPRNAREWRYRRAVSQS